MSGVVLSAAAAAPGFAGKLPAKGDFVSRRVPRSFLDPWEAWLDGALAASRAALGEGWLELYLASPIWHFSLAPGCCGPVAAAGVLVPSIDRVERCYPLAVVALLPQGPGAAAVPADMAWFGAAEAALLAGLDEGAAFERFDASVAGLGMPRLAAAADAPLCGDALRLELAVDGTAVDAAALGRTAATAGACGSLWWSTGSARVAPSLLAAPALPRAAGFAALLDGGWDARGWRPAADAGAAPAEGSDWELAGWPGEDDAQHDAREAGAS